MRQLAGDLSELRQEVVLPGAPIHGDDKPATASCGVVQAGCDVLQPLPRPRQVQVEGRS
jgi:hypothetical protein